MRLFAFVLAVVTSGPITAAPILLTPTTFGTVNDRAPTVLGDTTKTGPRGLVDDITPNLQAASTGTSTHRGIVEFDLSPVAGDILAATLIVEPRSRVNPPNLVEFHAFDGDGLVTFDDALADNLVTSVTFRSFSAGELFPIDVTSALLARPTFAGFMVRLADETGDNAQFFETNNAPTLRIESASVAVPAPTTLGLLAGALAVLCVACGRRVLKLCAISSVHRKACGQYIG